MISFVIPFKYSIERLKLLELTIHNLLDYNIKICIVELGNKSYFELSDYYKNNKIKYKFVQYNKIFHRALAINIGVKYLATENIIAILDGDIIFNNYEKLIEDIKKYGNEPYIAYNEMYFMDPYETLEYIKISKLPNRKKISRIRFSNPNGLAGGLVIIPRNIFFEIRGVPEMFEYTWGCDDNALQYKLIAYGYSFKKMLNEAYHLHHYSKTIKNKEIMYKINEIKKWDLNSWTYYNSINNKWGYLEEKK